MNFIQKCKNSAGFTLVELIVVIAILAILAGVAVPAYTGYIAKAEEAADQQLIGAINTAFAAASLENGVDTNEIKGVSTNKLDNGKVPATFIADIGVEGKKVSAADFEKAFDRYYAGNESAAFKTVKTLVFANGVFMDGKTAAEKGVQVSVVYKGNALDISAADIQALANSNLGAMGAGTLTSEMQSATISAGSALGDLTGAPFNSALASYLGLEADAGEDEIDAAIMQLAQDNNIDNPAVIAQNAIALYAAKNSSGITQEKITGWLTEDGVDKMMASPGASTLAEGAAIYGLYMSYKGEDFEGVSDSKTAIAILNDATTDPDFAKWAAGAEAKSELNAYMAAMNAISSATSTSGAAGSVLANGFNDQELVGILEGLMGG